MTPAEKALNLCQKFGWVTMGSEDNGGYTLSLETAKQCALICVDEIIQDRQLTVIGKAIHPRTKYWNEVKQEIEKL